MEGGGWAGPGLKGTPRFFFFRIFGRYRLLILTLAKTTLDQTLHTQVLAVAERAAAGQDSLARKRVEELEALKEELEKLERQRVETEGDLYNHRVHA